MGLPASPWTVASPRRLPEATSRSTVCCPRAYSLPSGDDRKDGGTPRRRRVSRGAVAAVIAWVLTSPAASTETLRVVATTSDMAALARAVTGDLAQVETIIPPAADPEAFEPRPSDFAKLKGASIVIRVGLGYDHWLDKLLSMQGDAAVNRGGVR